MHGNSQCYDGRYCQCCHVSQLFEPLQGHFVRCESPFQWLTRSFCPGHVFHPHVRILPYQAPLGRVRCESEDKERCDDSCALLFVYTLQCLLDDYACHSGIELRTASRVREEIAYPERRTAVLMDEIHILYSIFGGHNAFTDICSLLTNTDYAIHKQG